MKITTELGYHPRPPFRIYSPMTGEISKGRKVRLGDVVITPLKIVKKKSPNLGRYSKLTEVGYKLGYRGSRQERIHSLPERMTPKLGSLLGLLLSEGCVTKKVVNQAIFYNNDERMHKRFKRAAERIFPGLNVRRKDSRSEFSSAQVRRFLFNVGLGYAKAPRKRIPPIIFKSSLKVIRAFIHSFLDGDGCIPQGRTAVNFNSSSKKLVEDFQKLLLTRFGIVGSFHTGISKFHPTRKTKGIYRQYHLYIGSSDNGFPRYKELVGFGIKRSDKIPNDRQSPLETIPGLKSLINAKTCDLRLSKGMAKLKDGSWKRMPISLTESGARSEKDISQKKLRQYLKKCGKTLRLFYPKLNSTLRSLASKDMLFHRVVKIGRMKLTKKSIERMEESLVFGPKEADIPLCPLCNKPKLATSSRHDKKCGYSKCPKIGCAKDSFFCCPKHSDLSKSEKIKASLSAAYSSKGKLCSICGGHAVKKENHGIKCPEDGTMFCSETKSKYCSRKCYFAHKKELLSCSLCGKEAQNPDQHKKPCELCQKKFCGYGKYCGKKCSREGQIRKVSRSAKRQWKTPSKKKRILEGLRNPSARKKMAEAAREYQLNKL